jgi:hypothetical protein
VRQGHFEDFFMPLRGLDRQHDAEGASGDPNGIETGTRIVHTRVSAGLNFSGAGGTRPAPVTKIASCRQSQHYNDGHHWLNQRSLSAWNRSTQYVLLNWLADSSAWLAAD